MTDPSTLRSGPAAPGTVVGGRYELRAAVGHGGMGTVWRATDTQLNREVAVKEVVPPEGLSSQEREAMYERMLREARAAAAISHPSVVQVYDIVTDGGKPWVVMELLDARSLAEIILSEGPLSPRAVAKIGVALLGALEMAHAAGVLHRDVKPANVLIAADGRCVLTDFGVARLPSDVNLTTPGMVLGSPYFISPERALGASFGPPSDLFSLGVTLYTAVEGRPPFDRGDPISTMHAVVEDEPARPERAGPLTPVLLGLLDKDPERRLDAPRARAQLRELLAGPLASRSPGHVTDPQAVLPPRWGPQPPAPAGPAVGGRALLPPDHDPYEQVPDPYRQAADPYVGAGPAYGPAGGGYGAPADSYGAPADSYGPAADSYGIPADSYGTPADAAPVGGRRGPAGVGDPYRSTARRMSTAAGRVALAARRVPLRRAVTVAAVAAVAVVGLIVAMNLRGTDGEPAAGGDDEPTPSPTSAAPTDQPLIPVQQFADRGIVVNLPEGWREVDRSDIRVDFADPEDGSARIRLLQEPSRADAMRFIEIAEPNIRSSCDEPYQRVDLREVEVAGEPAALLEYTCGSGDEARHSLWATVVRDEEEIAYSFFLSVAESQFDQRRVIFDELLRSFRFAG